MFAAPLHGSFFACSKHRPEPRIFRMLSGDALNDGTFVLLVTLSFLGSAITAAIGAGGGLLMLAAMASLMPTAAVIPVHGLVQLGSNTGRTLMTWRHVAGQLCITLLAGAAVGTLIGALVLVRLPLGWLQLSIGLFILLVIWAPPQPAARASLRALAVFGAMTGFLSLFVGATGPLVSAYIQRMGHDRFQTVASMAACMSGLHILKLVAFSVGGFVWHDWLALAAAMILSGLAGTWCGLRLLGRLPEALFNRLLRWILSALALNLLYRGGLDLCS